MRNKKPTCNVGRLNFFYSFSPLTFIHAFFMFRDTPQPSSRHKRDLLFIACFFQPANEPVHWRTKQERHKDGDEKYFPPPDGDYRLTGKRAKHQAIHTDPSCVPVYLHRRGAVATSTCVHPYFPNIGILMP